MKATTKGRLKEEFNTGDSYELIVTRLNEDGLGRKMKSGTPRIWDAVSLSKAMTDIGLRKYSSRSSIKKAQRPTPTLQRKSTSKNNDRSEAAIKILKVDSLASSERIALALMVLEA